MPKFQEYFTTLFRVNDLNLKFTDLLPRTISATNERARLTQLQNIKQWVIHKFKIQFRKYPSSLCALLEQTSKWKCDVYFQ